MDINKLFKIVLIVFLLVIAGSVFYHYVIFLPKTERIKVEQEKLKTEQEKKQECYSIARASFDSYKKSNSESGSSYYSYGYEAFGYSPTFDTCVFSVEEILKPSPVVDSRIIVDAKTNRTIVDWVIWNDVIEDMRKEEGNNVPIVAGFDSEQKTNRELFEKIYNESF
jgi:hypothetical protein